MQHVVQPPLLMTLPFGILLMAIALGPLFFANWWSRHLIKVIFGLAALTISYYLGVHGYRRLLDTAEDYLSFMCVVGSLFIISGGIHIDTRGDARPTGNVIFLLIGALAANVLGAIGASMLPIRPWLRMNKCRLAAHHVLFFIFIVSNVGGSLTPLGPPLFLGYLKGVPFWWVAKQCWPVWLLGVGVLLAMFCLVDILNLRRARQAAREHETRNEKWRFRGLTNLFFLAVALLAVLINDPPFLREFLMVAAGAGSYLTTPKLVHELNDFNFHPINQVGLLFAGIFATMMPALDWLRIHATQFGQPAPGLFFWASGVLSSVLDNAPTYLSFLTAEMSAFVSHDTVMATMAYIHAHGSDLSAVTGPHASEICQAVRALQTHFPKQLLAGHLTQEHIEMALLLANPPSVKCLQALSMGSVFFGANTYIGNAPNFMVKAIADQQKVHTPTFLGYVLKFTIPSMLPMLALVWLLFFTRN